MSELRRFFFDDGCSRKRWQVRLRGKSQIVQYGRLGGSLRESCKAFKTPTEASARTDKLIATKKRDGYIEINPSRLEIVPRKGKKGATENQIKRLEVLIGCSLPDEYRNFLKRCNGGRPNPDCVQVPGVEYIDNVGVGSLFHLQPSQPEFDELSNQFARAETFLPKGHLPIAGSSDLFTLSLRPRSLGSVYWWNHESDEVDDDGNFLEAAGYLLAGSFDEFLTRIALLFGDDEQQDSEPSSRSGANQKQPKATVKRLLRLVDHEHTPEKIAEIEQVVKELGDLSGVKDGEWPFTNIRSAGLLRCLLKANLNPEITDTENQTLLWQCAGSVPCINLLLKQDVDIERRSGNERETALMRAIFLEQIPAVKRLIEAGANPTVRLQWYISDHLKYNKKLGEIVYKARDDWKRKKGKKAKRKKK